MVWPFAPFVYKYTDTIVGALKLFWCSSFGLIYIMLNGGSCHKHDNRTPDLLLFPGYSTTQISSQLVKDEQRVRDPFPHWQI